MLENSLEHLLLFLFLFVTVFARVFKYKTSKYLLYITVYVRLVIVCHINRDKAMRNVLDETLKTGRRLFDEFYHKKQIYRSEFVGQY